MVRPITTTVVQAFLATLPPTSETTHHTVLIVLVTHIAFRRVRCDIFELDGDFVVTLGACAARRVPAAGRSGRMHFEMKV